MKKTTISSTVPSEWSIVQTCHGFKTSPCCPLQADLDALSSWAADLNVSFNPLLKISRFPSWPSPQSGSSPSGRCCRSTTQRSPTSWHLLNFRPVLEQSCVSTDPSVCRPYPSLPEARIPAPSPFICQAISALWNLVKGLGPPALLDALPALASTRSRPTLRAGHSLQFPLCSSSRHQSSFLCHTIPIWNNRPSSVVSSSSRFFVSALSSRLFCCRKVLIKPNLSIITFCSFVSLCTCILVLVLFYFFFFFLFLLCFVYFYFSSCFFFCSCCCCCHCFFYFWGESLD